MSETVDLASRAFYRYFDAEKIRFSDTDMIGHVNNVAYAAILESGRTAFAHELIFPHMPPGAMGVMARIEINYRRELHWPATVDVASRLLSMGRSSYVIGQGIFQDEICITTGRTTIVMIDRTTRKAVALPEPYRAQLQRLVDEGR